MDFMEGAVEKIIGYRPEQVLGNRNVSYVGLTSQEDVDRVFADVDDAIEQKRPWNVFIVSSIIRGDWFQYVSWGLRYMKTGSLLICKVW